MNKLEVLMSCMYQKDISIVNKSKINSDCIVINQCNEEKYIEDDNIRMIFTNERGLSKSRNKALRNAKGDICLLCDDDETFVDNYEEIILSGFEKYQDADIIAYKLVNTTKKIKNKEQKVNYLTALKICSVQIAFKRQSIIANEIFFDENLGAGTPNGAGEETKFLYDALKRGLKIYYIPIEIASVINNADSKNKSQWFNGFKKEFWEKRGASTRYIMGSVLSMVYGVYFLIAKYKSYKHDISFIDASKYLFKGIFENKIEKELIK